MNISYRVVCPLNSDTKAGKMSRLQRVQLPTGQVVWAQISTDGPTDVSMSEAIKRLDLEDLRETITGLTESVYSAMESLSPDQMSLEFGLQLAVKTGKLVSVLTEISGNASLKVMMSWSLDERRLDGAVSSGVAVAQPDVVVERDDPTATT